MEDQAEEEKPKDETEKGRPLRWVETQDSRLFPSQRKKVFQEVKNSIVIGCLEAKKMRTHK